MRWTNEFDLRYRPSLPGGDDLRSTSVRAGDGNRTDTPYGSAAVGSKYQGQRGPTPSRYYKNFEQ